MFKKCWNIGLVFILSLTLFTGNIFACACCAENGLHFNWNGKTDNYTRDLLKEMKFADKTDIFYSEAGWETVTGLDTLTKMYPMDGNGEFPFPFNSSNLFNKGTWTFNLTTKDKKARATLVLPVPEKMSMFKVDIFDGNDGGAGSPLLYKEWRFEGIVKSGTGFVKNSLDSSTNFKLVFQGRGNGCDNAEDFTNWHLFIKGKKADYEFLGKMSSGVEKNKDDSGESKKN
jgi:hypothetical protein